MATETYTLRDAASALGVSTRQVRRYISQGKLRAELIPGKFGAEYRITEIPSELVKQKSAAAEASDAGMVMANDMIKRLQDENLRLAAQLGAASERIKGLETQLCLIAAPKKAPWWQRLFRTQKTAQ